MILWFCNLIIILDNFVNPVEDKPDSFLEDCHVEAVHRVVRLVVVHCNPGGEQDGRDTVLQKYLLVAYSAVENIGEILAAEIVESQFKTAYNPNLGAAMSLILMVLIFVCVSIMNRFGENEDEEVMAKV